MPNYNKQIDETTVRISEVRFSYVSVFQRRRNADGTEGKYSICLVWPKTNKEATALAQSAIEATKQNGKSLWGGKIPANCKTPIRDGDIDRADDPVFAGCWFMNATTQLKPKVQVLEPGAVVDVMDAEEFYSGCYGAASIHFYAYDRSGNKGVGASLSGVIKVRDGERLVGGSNADFSDMVGDLLD